MMRAFEARGDCAVVDEPFYAWYLNESGSSHPMREEVLASQPTNWRDVVAGLFAPLPSGITMQYQKQMAHHMVGDVGDEWFNDVRHAFLVREPAAMIASYTEKRGVVTAQDLGLEVQRRIYERVCRVSDAPPPVVVARDMLEDPPGMLAVLCTALGIDYTERMLRWEPGLRASDGVWASHWYNAVSASSGFAPPHDKALILNDTELRVRDECQADFDYFVERKLRV